MSGKRGKTKGAINLPRFIRDELRMTCALKGYSSLKTGKSRRLPDQYLFMEKFYHGKVPSHPAQIQLLAEGHLNYRDMYDSVSVKVTKKKTSKSSTPSATRFKLKDILSNNSSRSFYCGEDILYSDLEKKNKVGKQLITGRNLHAMAIRGARAYKKALAFSTHRWDSVTMQPKKSGETLDDVIEYVRRSMYKDKLKEKSKRTLSSDTESDEENDEGIELEAPPPATVPSPPSTSSTNRNPDTEDNDVQNDNSESDSEDDSEIDEDASESDTDVPLDYLFPSFYVFVLYGPFVSPSNRLDINLVDNKGKKKGEGTRAELRKKEAADKKIDSSNDTQSARGFTTDQRIDIETLGLQKESMLDRKNEVAMVALSLEETSMSKLVEAAERRASQRCPKYNKTNVYWKKVDQLLIEQEELMTKIRLFNTSIMDQKPSSVSISEFLNEPSPSKKRKAADLDDADTDGSNENASPTVTTSVRKKLR